MTSFFRNHYNYLFRFFCFYSVFNEHLVGPSGLEPPTSCLSGTRSNLLSYEPMWLVWCFTLERFFEIFTFTKWKFHFGSAKISLAEGEFHFDEVKISLQSLWLCLVEMMGFEPMTPCLQGRCSPSWATPPLWEISYHFTQEKPYFRFLLCMSALDYLPVQLPVKYFRHCRA